MGSTTRSPCWQPASSPTLNKSKWHFLGACSSRMGHSQHFGLRNPLPCLPQAPNPSSQAHPGIEALQARAVSTAEHPWVGSEVTPAPGRMVPKKHGLGVMAELLQPVGRWQYWYGAELPRHLGSPPLGLHCLHESLDGPECPISPSPDAPEVDSPALGADRQLPGKVRAAGWGAQHHHGATAPATGSRAAPAELPPHSVPSSRTYLTVRQEAGTSVRMTCSGVGAAPVLPGTLQTPQ